MSHSLTTDFSTVYHVKQTLNQYTIQNTKSNKTKHNNLLHRAKYIKINKIMSST